jgi:capsular polysaccharide transport system ATP-binding protein
MIELINVRKSYRTLHGRQVILDGVSVAFPTGRRVGVLGANGAGKSTLIRLLAGVEPLNGGRIRRQGRVSFPLGFGGTFHPNLSGRENVQFLARLYGASERRVLDFVADFSELGAYIDMPVETYSSGMRAKLAFGTCLAIDFDVFLIDEVIAVGDARFQARCQAAFEARMNAADLIMVTHSLSTIRAYCDSAAVLAGGRLAMFGDLEQAIGAHAAAMRQAPAMQRPPLERTDA